MAASDGAKVDDGDTITTYTDAELGITSIGAIDVIADPDNPQESWVFLGTDDGIRWSTGTNAAGDRIWRSNFENQLVTDVVNRGPGDLWLLFRPGINTVPSLGRLTYDRNGSIRETTIDPDDFCDKPAFTQFTPDKLLMSPEGDWWLAEEFGNEFNLPGLCRLLGGSTPIQGQRFEPAIGDLVGEMDIDSDGRNGNQDKPAGHQRRGQHQLCGRATVHLLAPRTPGFLCRAYH
jgi:hypothetical protein